MGIGTLDGGVGTLHRGDRYLGWGVGTLDMRGRYLGRGLGTLDKGVGTLEDG